MYAVQQILLECKPGDPLNIMMGVNSENVYKEIPHDEQCTATDHLDEQTLARLWFAECELVPAIQC